MLLFTQLLTKHSVIILGTKPPSVSYPSQNPLPDYVTPEFPPPKIVEYCPTTPVSGTIETYTVEYDRAGNPKTGWVIGRLDGSERFMANVDVEKEKSTVRLLTDGQVEPIGMKGLVWGTGNGGRNYFRMGEAPKM
jgi:acetyl-CoA C-acetyltransferase